MPHRARLRIALVRSTLAALTVFAVGTAGYMVIEGWSPLDAVYMTAITVTTIGFKEVLPLSAAGRLFTIFMAFAGIGVILLVATEAARSVLQADLRAFIGLRRELSMIKKLSNHIVVAGYGRMGRAVVEVLRARRIPFVVIESDTDITRELADEPFPVVVGDASEEQIQLAAGVPSAKSFLSCLADDAHNVFAILLARQLNPDIVAIARAVEEQSEERLRLAGATKVINPYRLGGMRLALTALKPSVMDFVETSLLGTSIELELMEVKVHPGSELAGKTLAEAEVRRRFGVIVVAILRPEGSTFNPAPDARIEGGDILAAMGPLSALERIERASQ